MNAKRALLSIVVASAAGAAITRAVRRRMGSTIDEWVAADGDDPVDPLDFPGGTAHTVPTHDGGGLEVVDCGGEGPAVLLVHGYTGTRGHWGPVAASLCGDGFRVLAYEQRGHGSSTVGDDGFAMPALGRDMRTVLEHFDLRDVVVAGHSMGGMALQAYLGDHPESAEHRVKAAFLVSTSANPSPMPALLRLAAARVLATPLVDRALTHHRAGAFRLRDVVGAEPRFSHLHAARTTVVETAPMTRLGAFKMLMAYDLTEQARAIDVPAVIMVGTHDNLTPIERSRELAELVPDAELVVYDGAGHMLPWERTEAVSELIGAYASVARADLPDAVSIPG